MTSPHAIAARYKRAYVLMWEKAQADLETFNRRYEEAQRLREPVDEDNQLLYDFAFRKNGTTPTTPGGDFHTWMEACILTNPLGNPDEYRPEGTLCLDVRDGKQPLSRFLDQLEDYKDGIQAVLVLSAEERFTYQGFPVRNFERIDEVSCRKALEGIDYVVALFKRNGMTPLLQDEIRQIVLTPKAEDWAGLYNGGARWISLNVQSLQKGLGRFIDWVNEVFLHEVGHHIHMNYITGEARAAWDEGWSDVNAKKEAIEVAFKQISREERLRYYTLLKTTHWDVGKAAKKLGPVDKVKFGVWLRSPMVGDPLITEKQFRWTDRGRQVALYMVDPEAYLWKNYEVKKGEEGYDDQNLRVAKKIAEHLGLTYGGNYPVPRSTVEELVKSNPEMDKAVNEALDKLGLVSGYARTNEREDFAETFVAFMAAPQKLTPESKFRMQRALSLSGLYGKPVMRLSNEHYIELCAVCGTTISRCRCMGPHEIHYGICEACQARARRVASRYRYENGVSLLEKTMIKIKDQGKGQGSGGGILQIPQD